MGRVRFVLTANCDFKQGQNGQVFPHWLIYAALQHCVDGSDIVVVMIVVN